MLVMVLALELVLVLVLELVLVLVLVWAWVWVCFVQGCQTPVDGRCTCAGWTLIAAETAPAHATPHLWQRRPAVPSIEEARRQALELWTR